jgi:hypothetical protein
MKQFLQVLTDALCAALIYRAHMPHHDLPDRHDADDNIIDIRARLQERVARSAQDNDGAGRAESDWEIFQRAEYGDGRPPKFNRHDLLWIGVFLGIGWVFWVTFHR